jgi:hypothetical protein
MDGGSKSTIDTSKISGGDGDGIIRSNSNSAMNTTNYNPMPHVIPTGENAAPLSVIGCTATEKVIIIMVGVSE